jgi:peptidoglycan DL-endopeptidase CwlO
MVGMGGVCPNAANLASYIAANYPGVLSIGGVRADRLPDHPSGHAIDVMVGGNSSLGYAINNDVLSQRGRFGVKYTMWMVPQHHDHVHITVF